MYVALTYPHFALCLVAFEVRRQGTRARFDDFGAQVGRGEDIDIVAESTIARHWFVEYFVFPACVSCMSFSVIRERFSSATIFPGCIVPMRGVLLDLTL